MAEQVHITKNDVTNIVSKLYTEQIEDIHKITNGNTNIVYRVRVHREQEDIIVRISTNQIKINDFMKEQWCCKQMKKLEVPVPEILEVGNSVIPYPYMVVKELKGIAANKYKGDLRDILVNMGYYLSKVHSIETLGYGHVFDWSDNKLSRNKTWQEFLEKEYRMYDCFEIYAQNNILEPKNLEKLKNAFAKIHEWYFSPKLAHGDYQLKNIIVDESGTIEGIIDWERAMSSKRPHWDLSISIATSYHDYEAQLTKQNISEEEYKKLFLKGYGMDYKEYLEIERDLKFLAIPLGIGTIKWYLRDKMDKELEETRVNLNRFIQSI